MPNANRWRLLPLPWLVTAALCGCGTVQVPPPPAPPMIVPRAYSQPASAPVAGEGTVLLDAVDGRAQVIENLPAQTASVTSVAGGDAATVVAPLFGPRPLCDTPCIVNLPYGAHQVTMSLTDEDGNARTITDILNVGPQPSVYRAALGGERLHPDLTLAAIGLGSASMVGVSFSPILLVSNSTRASFTPVMVGSIVAGLVSVVLAIEARPEEQVGTGVQWTP